MRVPTLCLKSSVDIKMGGRSPEVHNRQQLEKLSAHLVRCQACQRLAGVSIPEVKEPSASSPTANANPSSNSSGSYAVEFDDSGLQGQSPNGGTGTRSIRAECISFGERCAYHNDGGPPNKPCGGDPYISLGEYQHHELRGYQRYKRYKP